MPQSTEDACGPHCPDGFHHHYYSGMTNPTRFPCSLEAEMQSRATERSIADAHVAQLDRALDD